MTVEVLLEVEAYRPRPEDSPSDRLSRRESNGALSEPVGVKVVLMGELKRWAGKQDVDVELPPGSTVQTLELMLLPVYEGG
ncbi:MAG: hypothetical protein HYT78_18510 [Deltaproteobacteria bacterium]|nr:hypothetical protein [Deltaproteobacteria bacterium]